MAIRKFDEIVDYLETEVSEKSAAKFVRKVDNLIEKLLVHPEIGRKTRNKKTVRQYRLGKYKRFYYRMHGKRLTVIYIFDDRQKPESNPYN